MSSKKTKKRIYIFDTTLRDGEQSPGASMSVEEKLLVAQQLKKMHVDSIEAGFPISSPVQFEAVKLIAQKVKGPIITGLARAMKKDIEACYNATKYSSRPGIHTFIATSDIHLKHKLKVSRERALEMAYDAVKFARSKVENVEFSAEDATRTDLKYLAEVVRTVIKAGAKVINLPDTVGYAIPSEHKYMIEYLLENVPESRDIKFSVHCHNDLGLATANSLAAVEGGALQVETSINGIGERAGNAALEEVVMGLYTRSDYLNAECKVDTTEIYNASKLVSSITGISLQPNKAIVGVNAFAHEAGIHQDGVLKNKKTYEIMNPKVIGIPTNKLVLGRHSGIHGFSKRVESLGFSLNKKDLTLAFNKFLILADKKKEVYDDDLLLIINEVIHSGSVRNASVYELKYFHVLSGNKVIPDATVVLSYGKDEFKASAIGDGPVDAVYKAIEKITDINFKLENYKINSATSGKDAQGEVSVMISYKKKLYTGHGSSTDVVEASTKALLSALNRILLIKEMVKKNK